jgi:Zn-dependent membrane protease YugP
MRLTIEDHGELVALELRIALALLVEVESVFAHRLLFLLLVCHQSVLFLEVTVFVSSAVLLSTSAETIHG